VFVDAEVMRRRNCVELVDILKSVASQSYANRREDGS
jgi:hypothetical protein